MLVLSAAGLHAEAEEQKVPLEVVEHRAVVSAAEDVVRTYGVSRLRAIRQISSLVSEFSD
jgi:hypothetical protein